ncbi:MAG: hypothetical protein ACRDMJ_11985 [Solirubrobacteraceae bacterium]
MLTPPDHEPAPLASPSELELGPIRDARRRQRRRRLVIALLAVGAIGAYVGVRGTATSAPRSGSLLARALHFPSLGPGGRCPVSSGYVADNAFFGGAVLGHGQVRVLVGNTGDVARFKLGTTSVHGWYAFQTLWFAMPSYNGPFVVRGARLGRRGPIAVQPGGDGQSPGSGPLVVPAGATINTYYTNWRPERVRDPVSGRPVTVQFGYGYRTVPGSTWVRSPGCYAWQVDGRGFSEMLVLDALAPSR